MDIFFADTPTGRLINTVSDGRHLAKPDQHSGFNLSKSLATKLNNSEAPVSASTSPTSGTKAGIEAKKVPEDVSRQSKDRPTSIVALCRSLSLSAVLVLEW